MTCSNLGVHDGENGEVIGNNVIVLRRRSDNSQALQGFHTNYRNRNSSSYQLSRERQLMRGFRIQDVMNRMREVRRSGSRLDPLELEYHRELMEYFQSLRYQRRPPFRVPSEILVNTKITKPNVNTNTVFISYWEQFLYGAKVFEKRSNPGHDIICESPVVPYRFLKNNLPDIVVTLIVYLMFFLIYFCSIFFYNMFLETAGYIVYARHLELHKEAYRRNIDVDFSGSPFQGPAVCCFKEFCAHCQQKELTKIVNNHMKRMKMDILERQKQNT